MPGSSQVGIGVKTGMTPKQILCGATVAFYPLGRDDSTTQNVKATEAKIMGANVHEVWVMLNWECDSSEAIE